MVRNSREEVEAEGPVLVLCLPHIGPVPKPRDTELFAVAFSTVHPSASVIHFLLLSCQPGHGDCGRLGCIFYSHPPSSFTQKLLGMCAHPVGTLPGRVCQAPQATEEEALVQRGMVMEGGWEQESASVGDQKRSSV